MMMLSMLRMAVRIMMAAITIDEGDDDGGVTPTPCGGGACIALGIPVQPVSQADPKVTVASVSVAVNNVDASQNFVSCGTDPAGDLGSELKARYTSNLTRCVDCVSPWKVSGF